MWVWFKSIYEKVKILWRLASNAQYIADQEHSWALKKKLNQTESEAQDLRNQLLIKENAKFDGEFLWLNEERICLKCYDCSASTNRCVVRLLRNDDKEEETFYCPHCKSPYESIAAKKRRRDVGCDKLAFFGWLD